MRADPSTLTATAFDAIVVGGGIYGAMLALEATRRDLRCLLLEQDDFGGATSWNSLRIAHGGLRYLQTLDLRRYRESVGERRWLLSNFPELVRPLPCLMPLHDEGARRVSVLRAAIALNDRLSRGRNDGLPESQWLPDGSVLDAAEVARRFGDVDRRGLRGGALWYDGVILSTSRLLMEVLRWATAGGASPLNYVRCTGLVREGERVTGVRARDRRKDAELEFRGRIVINAAGPWCREVAALAGAAPTGLFRPSLAFNVLLDRAPLADSALAVRPRRKGGRVYFMYPHGGRTLAGTYHAPWSGSIESPRPSEEQVADFLADLDAAIPGWNLRRDDVVRVLGGLLPAAREGSIALASRELIVDHGARGGPKGLYSVSGVKYTTARLVAAKTFDAVFGRGRRDAGPARPRPVSPPGLDAFLELARTDHRQAKALVESLAASELVLSPDDLILRRTDWGLDPRRLPEARASLSNFGT